MIELEVEQGIPQWFEYRRGIPTCSSFDEIITPAKGELSKSCTLYIGKIIAGEQSPEVGPAFDTYWTERGIDMEPEARAWYEMHTGFDVLPGGIIFNDDKTAAYSPDGRMPDRKGLLEIKCLAPATHIKYLLELKGSKEIPNTHKPQVHGGLAIADGYDWTDYLLYCPGYKELLVRVIRGEYTKKVSAALAEFIKQLEIAKREVLK